MAQILCHFLLQKRPDLHFSKVTSFLYISSFPLATIITGCIISYQKNKQKGQSYATQRLCKKIQSIQQ